MIVVPVRGKPQFYDMDNDAANERAAFERLYGKLPDFVPKAGNTDEMERPSRWIARDSVARRPHKVATDTIPGGGDSDRQRIQLIGEVGGRPDSAAPLYIVDGKWMPSEWEIGAIPVELVKSVNVIGPGPAAVAYGERAKHGALLVTTKDPGHDWSKDRSSGEKGIRPVGTLRIAGGQSSPIYLINGREVPADTVKRINSDSILSIDVLKDLANTNSPIYKKYGDRVKNGVVIIHMKGERKPYCLVDGREVSWDSVQRMNPDVIESMNVLNAEEARAKYGEKGKNGVVLIALKPKGVGVGNR